MIKNFEKQNAIHLIDSLRKIILEDANSALTIIEKLEKTERFHTDAQFHAVIMIEKISALTFLGSYEQISPFINDVYKKILALNNTKIHLEAYSRLAVAYSEIGELERSIKLLNDIYKTEKSNKQFTEYSAIACANLGLIYYQYKQKSESYFYYNIAIDILEQIINFAKPSSEQLSIYIYVNSNLAIFAFDNNDIATYNKHLNNIENVIDKNSQQSSILAYKEAKLFQCLLSYKEEIFTNNLTEILALLYDKKDYPRAATFLLVLSEAFKKQKLPKDKLVHITCSALDIIGEKAVYSELRNLYLLVINYAIQHNNYKMMKKYYQKLKFIHQQAETENDFQKSQAIDFFIEHAKQQQKHNNIIKKNEHLTKINKAKQEKNLELKLLHDRLRIITKIGEKITSVSELRNLEEILLDEFSALMPLDSIVLFTKMSNEEHGSTFIHSNGEFRQDINIDINDSEYISAKAYKENKILFSNDLHQEKYFIVSTKGESAEKIASYNNSAIYYPITRKDNVIGVFSVQAMNKNAYDTQHLDLIAAIAPYIAIALINWEQEQQLQEKITLLNDNQNELAKLVQHNKKLNNIDPLTKIANRHYFNDKLKKWLEKTQQENYAFHIFMLDIDDFKLYNDINGHPKGDKALIKVAQCLNKQLNDKNYFLARYGGEEFILLAKKISADEALKLAEQLRSAVVKLNIHYKDDKKRHLTISIGVGSATKAQYKNKNSLIQLADDNLYKAKSLGKNRVVQGFIGQRNEN